MVTGYVCTCRGLGPWVSWGPALWEVTALLGADTSVPLTLGLQQQQELSLLPWLGSTIL